MGVTSAELNEQRATRYQDCTVSVLWGEAKEMLAALSDLADFLAKTDKRRNGQYAIPLKEGVKSLRKSIEISEIRHDFITLCKIKRWRGGGGAAEFGLSRKNFEAFYAGERVSVEVVRKVKAKLKEWRPGSHVGL